MDGGSTFYVGINFCIISTVYNCIYMGVCDERKLGSEFLVLPKYDAYLYSK